MTISNGVKKILFFLLAFFFLMSGSSVSAQVSTTTECAAVGGTCKARQTMFWSDDDSCASNEDTLGVCTQTFNNSACCKLKDNGPVDLSYRGIDLDEAQETSVPITGKTKCEAPKSAGGWGGVCKRDELDAINPFSDADFCNDSGDDEEDFVGFCQPQSLGGIEQSRTDCCVAKGTAIKNPTPDHFIGLITEESTCEDTYNADGSGYGGKCEDIDSTNWDPTGGFIDGKQPTCDTPGEVVVAFCEGSGDGGDAFNGCCVPKDGDYCKNAEQAAGYDACALQGAGGRVTPLEYGDYTLLEQIPGSSNTSGKLQPYLESIYKAGLVLIVLGSIFMISMGGFLYMSSAGNTAMIKKGKGMITDAVIGLVVALLVWLVLNIINPDLVNLKIDPLPGISFDPGGRGATTAAQNTATEGGGGTGTFAAKLYSGSSLYTDSEARAFLSQNGVGVNKADCSSPTQTNCTSLGQFPGKMAGTAAGIKKACNCEVTITGGTEAGHSTHGKGRAAMDIRRTSTLDNFFSTKGTPAGSSRGNPIYRYGSVKVWFEDSAHYHIWEPAN